MKKKITPTQILTYLQEHGDISDNCFKLDQVANDKEAHKKLVKNYDKFKKWMK